MFRSVETLDPKRHAGLVYRAAPGFGFAREVTSAPLAVSEVVQASREFPVVFAGDGKLLPIALMSVRRGQNPFVTADGEWAADYVPAHIRRYPFILAETGDSDRFLVMIDRMAERFAGNGAAAGERLFDADGGEPEGGIVARAKRFLGRFQHELTQTQAFLTPLEEHGILVGRQFTISRGDRSEVAVHGFRMVDTDRLKQLDDAVLAGWVRSGLMGLVDAHVHSLANAQRLLRRHGGQLQVPEPA